jgi:hypothetical protein
MDKIVCTACGSSDVELKAWVKPNENCECTHPDDLSDYLSKAEDCFCNNCGENVPLKMKDENNAEEEQ